MLGLEFSPKMFAHRGQKPCRHPWLYVLHYLPIHCRHHPPGQSRYSPRSNSCGSKNPVKCHFQLLVCYVIPSIVSHS